MYIKFYTIYLVVIFILGVKAQSIDAESKWITDDIPATSSRYYLKLNASINENFKITGTYNYLFTDQNEFAGLPRIRKSIHSLGNYLIFNLRQLNLELTGGGKINVYPNEAIMGDYYFKLQLSQTLSQSFDGSSSKMTLAGELYRERETSIATAIQDKISSNNLVGSLDFNINDMFTISGKIIKQYYSDSNEKINAYGVLLFHPLVDPWLAVGYAYAYANSKYDNWKLSNSTRVGFDPRTRLAIYEYSYFYNPYFTPIEERGHLGLLIVRWGVLANLSVYAKATIPIWSIGLQKYFPSTGNTPAPIDYNAYYELEDILPAQFEASIISDILDPVTIRLNYEYFKKPYYSYYAFGLNMLLYF